MLIILSTLGCMTVLLLHSGPVEGSDDSLLPMQLPWESCVKPVRHFCLGLHRKEPSVFSHTEPTPQLWVRTMHSSMSVGRERFHICGINTTCVKGQLGKTEPPMLQSLPKKSQRVNQLSSLSDTNHKIIHRTCMSAAQGVRPYNLLIAQ